MHGANSDQTHVSHRNRGVKIYPSIIRNIRTIRVLLNLLLQEKRFGQWLAFYHHQASACSLYRHTDTGQGTEPRTWLPPHSRYTPSSTIYPSTCKAISKSISQPHREWRYKGQKDKIRVQQDKIIGQKPWTSHPSCCRAAMSSQEGHRPRSPSTSSPAPSRRRRIRRGTKSHTQQGSLPSPRQGQSPGGAKEARSRSLACDSN
jgi:hypothetical protein